MNIYQTLLGVRSRNGLIPAGKRPADSGDARWVKHWWRDTTVVTSANFWNTPRYEVQTRENAVVTADPRLLDGAFSVPDLASFVHMRPNTFLKIMGDPDLIVQAMSIETVAIMFLLDIDVDFDDGERFPDFDESAWTVFDTYKLDGEPTVTVRQLRRKSYWPQTLEGVLAHHSRKGLDTCVAVPEVLLQVARRLETNQPSYTKDVPLIVYDAVWDLAGWANGENIQAVLKALHEYLKRPHYGYHVGRYRDSIRDWSATKSRSQLISSLYQAALDLTV